MSRFYFVDELDIKHITFGGDVIIVKHGIPFSYTYPGRKKKRPFFGHKYGYGSLSTSLFKLYSDFFQLIPEIFKAHWHEYKQYIGASHSGRNPFLKNNIQVGYAQVSGYGPVSDITSPPQYPDTPLSFSAYFDIDLDGIVIDWLNDQPPDTLIETGMYNPPGFIRPAKEWVKIVKGYLATDEEALVPGRLLNAGRSTLISLRSINTRGEVSPWANFVDVEVSEKPVANFTGSPRKGPIPLEVAFNDLSTGLVKSWLWAFGDGNTSESQHPIHTYTDDQDYFNVKLTVFGVAGSKNSKTKYRYIKPSDIPEDFEYFFLCDTGNYLIIKLYTADLSDTWFNGTYGTGNYQFKQPVAISVDSFYIYVCDQFNNRITKFSKYEFIYQAKYDYPAPDPEHLVNPCCVIIDDTMGYIADHSNDRIVKFTKYNMIYHSHFGPTIPGTTDLNGPYGVSVDDEYLYVTDSFNDRIIKFNKFTNALNDKIGSHGSGDDQFDTPRGIAVDKTHIFIVDRSNHRIVKRKKSDLSFVAKIGSQGSGNDQFNYPNDITVGNYHLFIADTVNNRIVKRKKSDLSYVSEESTFSDGYYSFNAPKGIGILSPYSY